MPAAAASAAGRIPDEASSAEKVWMDDIEAEIEKRRNVGAGLLWVWVSLAYACCMSHALDSHTHALQ